MMVSDRLLRALGRVWIGGGGTFPPITPLILQRPYSQIWLHARNLKPTKFVYLAQGPAANGELGIRAWTCRTSHASLSQERALHGYFVISSLTYLLFGRVC